jgi:hypothetical protein
MDHRFDEVIIEDIAGIVAWYGKETVVTSPDDGKSSGVLCNSRRMAIAVCIN